jgi:hypothetical protein
MEEQKNLGEVKEEKNVLENGVYSVYGPDNGEIKFDKIELHSGSGAKRIWKVKSFDEKNIVLEVEKFG